MFLTSIINEINLKSQEEEDKQQEYEPFKRPPDIVFAKNHAKANQFSSSKDIETNIENVQYCPCCGFPIVDSKMNLCTTQTDLAINGVGIPLLFQFMQFVAFLMSFNFLVSGLYNTIQNSRGMQCKENYPICKENYYTKYSLVNSDRQSNQIQLSLDLINIIFMTGFSIYYRRFLNLMALQIDENTISISDFSVQISNIPKSATKQQIADYFSQIRINDQKTIILQIKQIILGYDIQDYYKLNQRKIEIELKMTSILAQQESLRLNSNTLVLENELDELNQKIKEFQTNQELFKFSGVAFITYNTSNQARQIREYHKQTKIQYLFQKIFFFNKPLLKKNTFQNKVPYIIRAPEPGDIIWENLGINPLSQLKYQIFTNLGSIAILIICFCSILGISVIQEKISNSDSKQTLGLIITLFGLTASFIISFLNNLMGVILRKLVHLEMHSTQTEFNISFANKLGISQFINTAIIPLLVNIALQDKDILTQTWKNGGLVSDVCLIFIMNAIFPWLINLFDPFYLQKIFQRKQIILQDQNCPLTQKEANQIFEGQIGDISKKYASITKTLLLSFFYSQLIPLGNVISLGFIFINYWVEKYLFIYRYSRGPTIGCQLATEMVDTYIELSILLFSVGNYLWQTLLQEEVNILVWIQLGFGIAQYLLPIDQIFEKFIKMQDPETPTTYEDNQLLIWDDYGKRNPVTMQNEIESWFQMINKRKTFFIPQQKKISGYFNRVLKENQKKDIELREKIANSIITSKFLNLLYNSKKIIPLHQEFISRLKLKTKKNSQILDQEQSFQCLSINQTFQIQDSRM